MELRPTADRVLIQPIADPGKTEAGIVVVNLKESLPTRGIVIATGPGKFDKRGSRVPMQALPGDEVIFEARNGHTINIGGNEVIQVHDDDIFAVVEG